MKRAVVALLAGGVALLPAARVDACAGCRNPSMPVARLDAVELAPREVRATAILGGTYLDTLHEAGCADLANCAEVPVQPTYLHHQKLYPAELRAIAEVGITRTLGFELQLPVPGRRARRSSTRHPTGSRTSRWTRACTTATRPWRASVIRGCSVAGARGWATSLLVVRAGLSLPLGRTEANPFALGDMGIRHEHIQFGTGTFDPVAGFQVTRRIASVQLAGYGQGQSSLYSNRHGFRGPNRFFAGIMGAHRLFGTLTGGLGVDLLYEGAERWDGRIQQDGNLGRTEILAAVTLAQTFGDTSISLSARFPTYRHIVQGDEPQGSLSSPVMLSLIVSRTFASH